MSHALAYLNEGNKVSCPKMSWFLKKRSLVDEQYFLWAWVRIAKWVLGCKYFAVAFILESCFSSALHFVFVHVKSNEFFHILKKAWTLLKMHSQENPLNSVGIREPNRVSLHRIGRERRPNQFYFVSQFCWGLWLPMWNHHMIERGIILKSMELHVLTWE